MAYILLKKILTGMFGAVTMAVTAIPAVAQVPQAADVFVGAPREIMPLLDKNSRLDMVDYFNSGLTTPSKNLFDGKARVTALQPETISLQTSGAESYTIAVLPVGKSFVIAVIQTLAMPEPDSNIKFYDAKWRQLDGSRYMKAPVMADWLTGAGRKNRKAVDDTVPFVTAEYVYDAATGQLTVTQQLERTLGKDAYAGIKEYVKPQLTYSWKGGKFKAN